MAHVQHTFEDLVCSLCQSLFKQPNVPKTLPNCSHVFCILCLDQLLEKDLYSPCIIKCPDCQTVIQIPEGGVTELLTDQELSRLAEIQEQDYHHEQSEDIANQNYTDVGFRVQIKENLTTPLQVYQDYSSRSDCSKIAVENQEERHLTSSHNLDLMTTICLEYDKEQNPTLTLQEHQDHNKSCVDNQGVEQLADNNDLGISATRQAQLQEITRQKLVEIEGTATNNDAITDLQNVDVFTSNRLEADIVSPSAPIKSPVAAPRRSLTRTQGGEEVVGNRMITELSLQTENIAKPRETTAETQINSNIVAQTSGAQELSTSVPITYPVAAPRRSLTRTQGGTEVVENRVITELSSKKEDIAKPGETTAGTQIDSRIEAQIPGAQDLSSSVPIKHPVAAPRRSLTRTQGGEEVVENRAISEVSPKKEGISKTGETTAPTQKDSNIVAQTSEATESPHTPQISKVVVRYSETSAKHETKMELNIDFDTAEETGTQELPTEAPHGLTSTAAPPFDKIIAQSETLIELNDNTAQTPEAKEPPSTTETPRSGMQLIPTVAPKYGETNVQNETHMKLNIVQNTTQTVKARKFPTANLHMPSTPATAPRDSETTAQNETHKEFNFDTDTAQTPGDQKLPTEIPYKKMIHTFVSNNIKPVEQSETHMNLHSDDKPKNLCAPENPVTSDRCGRPITTAAVPWFVETAAQNKTPTALNIDHKTPQMSGPLKHLTESLHEQVISAAATWYEEATEEVPQYDGQGRYRKCQLHTNYDVIFFCLLCEIQLCSKCFVAEHLQHNVKSLEEVASVFRSNKEKLDKQIAHSMVWKKRILQLEDLKTSFLVSLDKEYQQIDKSVGVHVNSIRREGKILSEELNEATTRHLSELSFTTTSTQSTTNHQISEELSYMLSNAAIIHHDPQAFPKEFDRNAIPKVYFEENPYLPLWGESRTIGRFVSSLQLHLSQEIHEFEKANSIAYAKNGSLLVSEHKRNHVKIYRKQNRQYTPHKVLKVSKQVLSVGATADSMYLVSTGDGISMFSESGSFMSHFIGQEDAVWHLVVAKGNVFGSALGKPLITEFDSSGTPVRSITTEIVPQSFTLIDENTIAVCYSNLLPGVDVINCQSQHERCAKLQRKIDVNVPLSLCFDEKSNSLLVGSGRRSVTKREYFKLGSGVIDQYCIETGQLVGRLAEGLYSPCCMKITEDSSLAVADWKSVKLYSLTRTDKPYRGKADHPTE